MSPTTQADDVVHRALKAVPMGALIGSLLLLFFGSARSVAQRTVDPIENALAATVYIEVDRLFRGTEFSSLGSGFFLTSGGYIMTNNHVVTDTQIERISGALVRFQFTIMGIRVVVNPRTPQQVVLPARVIALDRGRDLALLKVKYEPTHYLDLVEEKIPRLTEEVFVVGFPLGNLLTLNEHGWISPKGGYPEVSIGAGRVTSVRKDDDGSVVAIQTDAAMTVGNSGGPMVDTNGRLIGVVYSGITGGSQIGFAVSSNRISDFLEEQRLMALFDPPYITQARRSILVTVNAGALLEGVRGGSIVLSGVDIPTREFDLREVEGEWRGAVEIPPRIGNRVFAEYYHADVALVDGQGRGVAKRRYVLNVGLGDNTTGGPIDPTVVVNNQMTLQEWARKLKADSEAREGRPIETESETGLGQGEHTKRPPVDSGHLDALKAEARTHYRAGEYRAAVSIFEQILHTDPEDELARDYYELSKQRLRLEGLGVGDDLGTEEVSQAHDGTGPLAPKVDLTFDSPISAGSIQFEVDGDALQPVEFRFKKKSAGRRLEHTINLAVGEHQLQVRLVDAKDNVLGDFSFTEQFELGSKWTLRVTLAPGSKQASAFLVEREPR